MFQAKKKKPQTKQRKLEYTAYTNECADTDTPAHCLSYVLLYTDNATVLTSGVISAASFMSFQQDLLQDHRSLLQKHFYGGKRSEHFWMPRSDVIAVDSSLFDVRNAEVNPKSFFSSPHSAETCISLSKNEKHTFNTWSVLPSQISSASIIMCCGRKCFKCKMTVIL